MISHFHSRRVVTSVAASVFFGIAVTVAAWIVVHGVLASRAEEFRSRCLLYATTIANTIPMWVGQSDAPDLTSLSRYAAIAGLLYMQVTSRDGVLLEVAGFPGATAALADAEGPAPPRVDLRCIGGKHLADAAVEYGPPPRREGDPVRGPYASGTLRLGVDASALAWAAGNTKVLAAELAALAWAASCALAILFLHALRRPARSGTATLPPSPTGPRTTEAGCLSLHLDEARLVAIGRSVRLTPKQLDLLKVLMSDPGRTFSDEEILSRAWAGSPYADSRDVKQCVYLVRRRLSGAGLPGDRILSNVPGVGYRVDPSAADGAVEGPRDVSVIER